MSLLCSRRGLFIHRLRCLPLIAIAYAAAAQPVQAAGIREMTISLSDYGLVPVAITLATGESAPGDAGAAPVEGEGTATEKITLFSIVSEPANGSAAIVDGRIEYTPDPGFIGTDMVEYEITGETSLGLPMSSTATLYINVDGEAEFIAAADVVATAVDMPVTINVLENDSGFETAIPEITTQPRQGIAALDGDKILYTPDDGFRSRDIFTYTLTSPEGTRYSTTVTINVGDDAPGLFAGDDKVSATQGTSVVADVLENDFIAPGIYEEGAADANDEEPVEPNPMPVTEPEPEPTDDPVTNPEPMPEGEPEEEPEEPAIPTEGGFTTNGAQILDANGDVVEVRGVNWFGMERGDGAPDGLHEGMNTIASTMEKMKEAGFNAIRLPFSIPAAQGAHTVTNNMADADLNGADSLTVMEAIIDEATAQGMVILLDVHTYTAAQGGPAAEGGIPVGKTAEFVETWAALATRFADKPSILGADLFNEPHKMCWAEDNCLDDKGSPVNDGSVEMDWPSIATEAGNAVLAAAPNWLVFVEGVGVYNEDPNWWGGNIAGAADHPIQLDVANKLVYSPHEYGPGVHLQPWFEDPAALPTVLPENWAKFWSYLHLDGTAPVSIGEFGGKLAGDAIEVQWFEILMGFMAEHKISGFFWSWNSNSGDTGGIVTDIFTADLTFEQAKLDAMAPWLSQATTIAPGAPAAADDTQP